MNVDMPAFGQAAWHGFEAGKLPRPEYLIPVLYSESGLNPSVVNSLGCTGINQLCPFAWTIPDGYASWTASQQLAGPVTSMFAALISKYGAINSGTIAYVANFLPADVPPARKSLSYVLARRGDAVYSANPGLDYTHKGTITTSDMAHFVSRAVAPTQNLVQQVYALRPGARPNDPVYGTDFGRGAPMSPWTPVLVVSALGLAGVLGYHVARQAMRG